VGAALGYCYQNKNENAIFSQIVTKLMTYKITANKKKHIREKCPAVCKPTSISYSQLLNLIKRQNVINTRNVEFEINPTTAESKF